MSTATICAFDGMHVLGGVFLLVRLGFGVHNRSGRTRVRVLVNELGFGGRRQFDLPPLKILR
jgi:hypothetical protein